MNIFNLLFYKMFSAYSEKNDMAMFSTTLYMFALKFFICVNLIILGKKVLGNENNIVGYTIKSPIWFWGSLCLSILVFNYMVYFTQDFAILEEKYGEKAKWMKPWMISFLPVLILFGGILLIGTLF